MEDTTPKKQRKPRTKTAKLKKSFGTDPDQSVGLSQSDIIGAVRRNLGTTDTLQKSISPQKVSRSEVENTYSKSKIAFGSRYNKSTADNIDTKGYTRIQDSELRQLAQVDPYISAIIGTRVSQSASTGTKSVSKFKKGMMVNDLNPLQEDDFDNPEAYIEACNAREEQIEKIEQWVLSCGTSDQSILNYAFNGLERTFKYCSLRQFLEAQVRNLLTFGRCATQVFRNADGTPVMFRPAPVETIGPVIDGENTGLSRRRETSPESVEDLIDYNALPYEERPKAWVQRIDGQNVNFFTEDDMHVWDYQRQALFDLNGYPMSPIEQAVFMVFVHQQTLNYLKNQFTKGMASKGMIVLQSTSEDIDVSDADVEDFKQQFHNYVTRTDNSAVTPVIGGPIKAEYVNLSSTPRDMEFLQVEEHVIRALCSSFHISPQEMGYGHLSMPTGGLGTQGNKQEEIIKGEERGLRNVLDIVFEGINEIMFENFPEARKLFKISYVGVGEDTRDAVLQRSTQELNTTATMQSLWSDSEKSEQITLAATMPLAPSYHSGPLRYAFFWEIRRDFFGEEDAEKNPAYWFIIDPSLNEAYQSLRVQSTQMQQQGAEIQLETQKQQLEMGQMQMQQAQQQPPPGQPGQPQEGQPEQQEQAQGQEDGGGQPMKQSLVDRYKAGARLAKSMKKNYSTYFMDYVKAHRNL